MKNRATILLTGFIAITLSLGIAACKGDSFWSQSLKTNAGYTIIGDTVAQGTSIKVGYTIAKPKKESGNFDVTVSYLGGVTDSSVLSIPIPSGSPKFERDVTFVTRMQTGTETWTFTVTDGSGVKINNPMIFVVL